MDLDLAFRVGFAFASGMRFGERIRSLAEDKKNGWITIKGTPVYVRNNNLTGKIGQEIQRQKKEKKPVPKPLRSIYGKEFPGVKGQEAIEKLMAEKQGHVRSAFRRPEFGGIDLIWGNERLGLQHILQRRKGEGNEPEEFVKDLPNSVERGKRFHGKHKGDREFHREGKAAVVTNRLYGRKAHVLLTAFKSRKTKKPRSG